MTDALEPALALWGFSPDQARFVAGRENQVYRIRTDAGDFALRLKRPGYRSEAELRSELQWLAALDDAGLSVPRPLRSLAGHLLEHTGTHFVDVVGWLSGTPLSSAGTPSTLQDPAGTFHALGQEVARLHLACDGFDAPAGFTRCYWDGDGLLGETPLWGRFWENPTLDPATRDMLIAFRATARDDLERIAPTLDFGLIHADFVGENVLVDGDRFRLIDFDDGGFGFRLFDIATALIRNLDDPGFDAMKTAIVQGYQALRPLDARQLDLFLALRAVTYVGWIVPRMDEPEAAIRNARFIDRARRLCTAYLDTCISGIT